MNNFSNFKNYFKQEWISLSVLILVSSAIRLKINFDTQFIGGGNGAYYLVMLRDLLENGSLVQKDFPLLFWLEALLAAIPYKLSLLNLYQSIDYTSRVFDSVIPTLSVIPAWLIAKNIIGEKEKRSVKLIITSLSIFYISFFVLISEFHKNSLALLWLFSFIYSLQKFHQSKTWKNFLFAFSFLVLIALTHYGCLGIALAIILIDFLLSAVIKFNWKRFVLALQVFSAVNILIILLVNTINPFRLKEFITIPLRILMDPAAEYFFSASTTFSPIALTTIILVNVVNLFSICFFVRNYKALDKNQRSFMLTIIIVAFALASPLLGIEFAQRVYHISYLALVPLSAFVYSQLKTKTQKNTLLIAVLVIVTTSSIYSGIKKNHSNMKENIYAQMELMKGEIAQDEKTIIVARHGLEFWCTWIFRNTAIRQNELKESYWRVYNKVYFLVQKKDVAPFGIAGTFGTPYSEPVVPGESKKVYSNDYFDLYISINKPIDYSIFKEAY